MAWQMSLVWAASWDMLMSGGCGKLAPHLSWVLWDSWFQGMKAGELTLSLVTCRTRESGPLNLCITQETQLGSPSWESQVTHPHHPKHGRAGPTTCLPIGGMGKGEMFHMPITPCKLQEAEELAPSA